MFCPTCGTKRKEGGKFCAKCGKSFIETNNANVIEPSYLPNQAFARATNSYTQGRRNTGVTGYKHTRQKTVSKKGIAVAGVIAVALIVILVIMLGGNNGGLTGTWEDRDGNEWVFSESSVWIVYYSDGGTTVRDVSEGTYYTIDSEIRFYGFNHQNINNYNTEDINHYSIDGNNLFLGPLALTRVSSKHQTPTPIDPKGFNGTWNGSVSQYDGNDYIHTITFSGSSFTTTTYRRERLDTRQIKAHDPNAPIIIEPPSVPPENYLEPFNISAIQTESERNDGTVIHMFTVYGEYEENDYAILQVTGNGTFSINGATIEFIFSDGSTTTENFFFSTEDKLVIDGSYLEKSDTKR